MISSIQFSEGVKDKLLMIKQDKESFEHIIIGLIKLYDKQKKEKRELLIE